MRYSVAMNSLLKTAKLCLPNFTRMCSKVQWAKLQSVFCDVLCQKLSKSANVSWSYSKNKILMYFFETCCTTINTPLKCYCYTASPLRPTRPTFHFRVHYWVNRDSQCCPKWHAFHRNEKKTDRTWCPGQGWKEPCSRSRTLSEKDHTSCRYIQHMQQNYCWLQ